jgi:hypothetical protein
MATETTPLDREQEKQTAYLILLVGGFCGGLLAFAGIIGSYWWWGPFLAWLRDGEREKLWQPLLGIAGLLGGLALMFATFQAARRFERVDVTLRRVLYGYNAFLTGFLLLLLLVVVNVFVQVRYPLPYDTTEGGFYSLSEKTKQYVSALENSVVVYMVFDPDDQNTMAAYQGMKTILAEMAALNPRFFRYEEVSGESASRLRDLQRRFTQFTPRPGILVAYGDKPENNHTFIGASELSSSDFTDRANPQRSFNGEVKLMQELMFLAEEKRRPVIYFTQGHGEPDLNDHGNEGLADLAQRLTENKFDVRPLIANNPVAEKNDVPADAEVVVVVGPRRVMGDITPGLQRFMNPTDPKAKKGKLVVLLGPTGPDRQQANQMVQTGIEPLLRDFGVNAANEQILLISGPGGRRMQRGDGRPVPEYVTVGALQSGVDARHPLAMIGKVDIQFWLDVRRLEPQPGVRMQLDTVMVSLGITWLEGDMNKSNLESMQKILSDDEEAKKRVHREPFPVLVTASESTADPTDPHARPDQKPTPRLVVFGCSTLATNRYVRAQAGGIEFDLIRGSIDWCRERYTQIGIEPKSYRRYMLPKSASLWNLFYLPLAAMGLGVFGLGLIVWNIRRS